MLAKFFHGIPILFEVVFWDESVDLFVAWRADAHGFEELFFWKPEFGAAVGVAGSWDEVVTGQ